MNAITCCFMGQGTLPADKIEGILIRLNTEIDRLIGQGVTDFISGGAIGFDQIAASLIIVKKEMGHSVRLIFALPSRKQDEHWTSEQKRLYRSLLSEADEVRYVSEGYFSDSMKSRSRYMVDHSAYCVCAILHDRSETSQTVSYASEKGLQIIHVAE